MRKTKTAKNNYQKGKQNWISRANASPLQSDCPGMLGSPSALDRRHEKAAQPTSLMLNLLHSPAHFNSQLSQI